MADRRKLQGEIERTLKKVQEGVDYFEDLWQKVQNATNLNIKEKHEADLKKEIKKLQRLRDGIKTWLASSDIKDKKSLLDAKKVIETQMERFKVVERETKTKAYSKEGLGAATKVDPKEKEKEDIIVWLSQSIDEFNVQIDQFESEIEGIVSKKKKLDRDKQDQVDLFRRYLERHRFHIDKLETIMRLVDNDALSLTLIATIREDVEYYISTSSNREAELEDNEGIYDELKLEEASAALGSRLAAMNHDNDDRSSDVSSEAPSLQNSAGSVSPSPSLAHSKDAADDETGSRTRLKSQSTEGSVRSGSNSGTKVNDSSRASAARQRTTSLPAGSQEQSAPSTPSSAPVMPPSFVQNYAQAAGAAHHHPSPASFSSADKTSMNQDHTPSRSSTSRSSVSSASSTTLASLASLAAVTASTSSQLSASSSSSAPCPVASTFASPQPPHLSLVTASGPVNGVMASTRSLASLQTLAASAASSSTATVAATVSTVTEQQRLQTSVGELRPKLEVIVSDSLPVLNGPSRVDSTAGSLPSLMASPASSGSIARLASPGGSLTPSAGSSASTAPPLLTPSSMSSLASSLAAMSVADQLLVSQSVMSSMHLAVAQQYQQQQQQLQNFQLQLKQQPSIRLDPLLGIAPLGPQPLNRVHGFQLEMLDAVARHLPHPADSQRIRTYFPHSPYMSPAYHYQLPPTVWDTLEFYSRLDIDSLFFIFYYMEGTRAQYLAAKTLKLKSWRFHTKHLMWFQRHDEPTLINEDCEQGSYWYFDFETWTKRRQDNFVFEYKYLEDHDLK